MTEMLRPSSLRPSNPPGPPRSCGSPSRRSWRSSSGSDGGKLFSFLLRQGAAAKGGSNSDWWGAGPTLTVSTNGDRTGGASGMTNHRRPVSSFTDFKCDERERQRRGRMMRWSCWQLNGDGQLIGVVVSRWRQLHPAAIRPSVLSKRSRRAWSEAVGR